MGYGPWTTGCLLLSVLPALSGRADGAELGWVDVTVRLYHDGAVTEADEARALTVAADVLAAADVTLRWTHCHANATPDAACARPLAPGELALRLTRAAHPPGATQTLALGDAFVTAQGPPPALATLYVDRVDHLSQRGGGDAPVLLGRAIAHELTHLLTGSGRHATSGLMRPVWLAADLTRARATDWMLDSASVRRIRERTSVPLTFARNRTVKSP